MGPLPANLLAVTLPWIEVLAGALLVAGLWRREAAVVTGGLLITFIVAVGWSMYHGIDIENCGCFTVSADASRGGWALLAEDAGLLVLALLAALGPARKPEAPDAGSLELA